MSRNTEQRSSGSNTQAKKQSTGPLQKEQLAVPGLPEDFWATS